MRWMKTCFQFFKNKRVKQLGGLFLIVLLVIWWFSIPKTLFPKDYSQIVFSRSGELLGAKIATDEQWRFPSSDSIPYKFKQSILYFEDEYFYYHPGVNPISLFRALSNNISSGKVTSGASTLTMQTIRLSKSNPSRTYWEKCKEIFQATRLEAMYSKDSILSLYASHAPFGGNVVGIEAASWRYFGKLPHQLSWGESATLAVLPNAPSLIYPGKNQEKLLHKRNMLLKKLYEKEEIDAEEYDLALTEPLPQKPFALPQIAPHFIEFSYKKFPHSRIHSTLDKTLQEKVNHIVAVHQKNLSQKEIQNIAVIISAVDTGEVLAYVGNTDDAQKRNQNDVDINQAHRSSGSILKPILFNAMIDNGELFPNTLLSDTPSDITQNFSKQYKGMVSASEALAQSLNIPAIEMLRKHGVSNFHAELKQLGFRSITETPAHYGLSLIVGGAEISPWDLNNAYRNLAFKLKNGKEEYYEELKISENEESKLLRAPKFSTQSIYTTLDVLRNVVRPTNESGWLLFGNHNIAWKTGTSHGFRDAWSVGITPNYIISVWVGNADGEGRPGIIGVRAAAPILFDVFQQLPKSKWFTSPYQFQSVLTCAQSGYKIGEYCPQQQRVEMPETELKIGKCPFHQMVYLDSSEQFRVNSSCYPVNEMRKKVYFALPVIEEKYYKNYHPWYTSMPPFLENCIAQEQPMDFIYPRNFTRIYLPKNAENEVQPMIVKVSHKNKNAIITWTLDGNYIAQTTDLHEFGIKTTYGEHRLSLTDQNGNVLEKSFTIASKH